MSAGATAAFSLERRPKPNAAALHPTLWRTRLAYTASSVNPAAGRPRAARLPSPARAAPPAQGRVGGGAAGARRGVPAGGPGAVPAGVPGAPSPGRVGGRHGTGALAATQQEQELRAHGDRLE